MLPTEGLTKFMTMLGTLLACNKFVANVLSAFKSVESYRAVQELHLRIIVSYASLSETADFNCLLCGWCCKGP